MTAERGHTTPRAPAEGAGQVLGKMNEEPVLPRGLTLANYTDGLTNISAKCWQRYLRPEP